MASDLYLYEGSRRREQRFPAPGSSMGSNPTSSAFAWAFIIGRGNSQGLSVVSTPRPGSIGVSSTAGPDGHVAWITDVVVKSDGNTYVVTQEQVCWGSTGKPTFRDERPASYFDQGFIVKTDQSSSAPEAFWVTTGSGVSQNQKTGQTNFMLVWTASMGATEYQVLQWYFPQTGYSYSGWPTTDPPGDPTLIQTLSANELSYTWSVQSPAKGQYYFNVRAKNSGGSTSSSYRLGIGLD